MGCCGGCGGEGHDEKKEQEQAQANEKSSEKTEAAEKEQFSFLSWARSVFYNTKPLTYLSSVAFLCSFTSNNLSRTQVNYTSSFSFYLGIQPHDYS